jgi:hypothetical protein
MNPNNFLVAMLDVYVEWLNVWLESEKARPSESNVDFPGSYTMDTFLHYTQGVKAIVVTGDSSAYQRVLVEASVSDGDEGGPTDLTAWFDIRPDDGTNPLIAMVQGFDTSLQFIYNDSALVNTP